MFKRLRYNYNKNKQYKHVVQDVINYCKAVVRYGINGQIKHHMIKYLGDEQYPILISKEKVDSLDKARRHALLRTWWIVYWIITKLVL